MKREQLEELISFYIMEHYQQLYRLAYSYVHNEEDAMDMVQEGAYKAIKNWKSVKDIDRIGTWIYRIVINTSLDHIRKRKHEIVGIDNYEEGREDTYENIDVINSLNILSEKERSVIVLRFFEDRKLEEIAMILDEPVNSIKSKLYRSLKKLRIVLEEGEVLL